MAKNLYGTINEMTVVGNLGQMPEYYKDKTVSVLNIATTSGYVDKDNNKVEKTQWHRVVSYQPNLHKFLDILEVGDKLYVKGRLETRTYTGNDGVERHTTEIILDESGVVQLISKKNKNSESASQEDRPARQNTQKTEKPKTQTVQQEAQQPVTPPVEPKPQPKPQPAPERYESFDDDIPF